MTENIVILIADSLRADFWPDIDGTTFDVVTQGTESPTCVPSLLTGRAPDEHGIRWFQDSPTQVPTVFDLESEGYDVAYWDNPEDLIRNVLRAPPSKPLAEMEPPFVWVARWMLTHHPYGADWTDADDPTQIVKPEPASIREFPGVSDEWETGREYLEMMRDESVDYLSDYRTGIERTVERVEDVMDTLGGRGLMGDTTVLFTADHGEAFGGSLGYDDCKHEIHTHQACHHIVNVKGTFVGGERDVGDPVRQCDLLGLWDARWLDGRDDLDTIERDGSVDADAAEERLKHLGYL